MIFAPHTKKDDTESKGAGQLQQKSWAPCRQGASSRLQLTGCIFCSNILNTVGQKVPLAPQNLGSSKKTVP